MGCVVWCAQGCGARIGCRRRPRSSTAADGVGEGRLRAGRPWFRAPIKSPRGMQSRVLCRASTAEQLSLSVRESSKVNEPFSRFDDFFELDFNMCL